MPSSQKDQLSTLDNQEGEAKVVTSNEELVQQTKDNLKQLLSLVQEGRLDEANKTLVTVFQTLDQIS